MGKARSEPVFQSVNAFAVTPSDTVNLTDDAANTDGDQVTALYVGTGGTLKVTRAGGATVEYVNVPDGTFMPILVKRVWATVSSGTVCSNIIAEQGN